MATRLRCSQISWFPGHMAQAMAALSRVIKQVDLVLEVRDARVSA
jgi:ribosome biogenesis GTPase A